jgi:hypothetical protein
MSCQEFEEPIALAAGGDLEGPALERLERHLRHCATCRELAAGMEESVRAVRSLATVPVTVPIEEEALLGDLRAGVRRGIDAADRRRRRRGALPPWLAVAAAIAAVLVGGTLLLRSLQRPPTPAPAPASTVAERPPVAPPEPGEPTEPRAPVGQAGPTEPVPEAGSPSAPKEPEPTEPPSTRIAARAPEPAVAAADAPETPAEPVVIKWLTDDPDVVIYWLVDA